MPARGLWAVQQTELARSASAQRPRAGIFRDIQSITFLLHILPHNFHFVTLVIKFKTFELFKTLSGTMDIHLEKIAERFVDKNNKQTLRESDVCGLAPIKLSMATTSSAPGIPVTCCLESTIPYSSFLRASHDTILLTFVFSMSKSFASSRKTFLFLITSWQRLLPSLERRPCLPKTSTVTSRIWRHLHYYVMAMTQYKARRG